MTTKPFRRNLENTTTKKEGTRFKSLSSEQVNQKEESLKPQELFPSDATNSKKGEQKKAAPKKTTSEAKHSTSTFSSRKSFFRPSSSFSEFERKRDIGQGKTIKEALQEKEIERKVQPEEVEEQEEVQASRTFPRMGGTSRPEKVGKSAGVDFRSNMERQKKERKSVGKIIAIVSFVFLGLILGLASLATYGGVVVWQKLNDQSQTVSELDDKLITQVVAIRTQLADSNETILSLSEQIKGLTGGVKGLKKQNVALTKSLNSQRSYVRDLRKKLDKTNRELRTEKLVRQRAISEVKGRLIRRSLF